MKYKVGDTPTVKSDLKVGEIYGTDTFVKRMDDLKGKTVTITKVSESLRAYDIEESDYCFTDEMFVNEIIDYHKEHIALWDWLSNNPEKTKYDYFEIKHKQFVVNNCYACEFVDTIKGAFGCKNCPLQWGLKENGDKNICRNDNNLFAIYNALLHTYKWTIDGNYTSYNTTMLNLISEYARKIRDLEWIEESPEIKKDKSKIIEEPSEIKEEEPNEYKRMYEELNVKYEELHKKNKTLYRNYMELAEQFASYINSSLDVCNKEE